MSRNRSSHTKANGPEASAYFRNFAHGAAELFGSPFAFITALAVTVGWAALGHHYHYSDTWQLVINTGTTIVTFLMVFLIQNTQNRDAIAIHLKLDELIRAVQGARTPLVNLQELSDQELKALQEEFRRLHEQTSAEAATRPGSSRSS